MFYPEGFTQRVLNILLLYWVEISLLEGHYNFHLGGAWHVWMHAKGDTMINSSLHDTKTNS